MVRRLVIGVILFGMVLHCAVRIGLLPYIYERRHQIAFSVGIINEIPITMCSLKYTPLANKFVIEEHGRSCEATTPPAVRSAQEIYLLLCSVDRLARDPVRAELILSGVSAVIESDYIPPTLSIFLPPG